MIGLMPRKDTRTYTERAAKGQDSETYRKGPKVRGVRVEDELWEIVKVKAGADGLTTNEAVVMLLELYAEGTVSVRAE